MRTDKEILDYLQRHPAGHNWPQGSKVSVPWWKIELEDDYCLIFEGGDLRQAISDQMDHEEKTLAELQDRT